jgi:hypothetical protein
MNIPKLILLAISTIAISIYLDSAPLLAQGEDRDISEKTCRVTDPTGTPLNIRARPNGKIISKVRNGMVVNPQLVASDRGKPWALVTVKQRSHDRIQGWVIREFISCY